MIGNLKNKIKELTDKHGFNNIKKVLDYRYPEILEEINKLFKDYPKYRLREQLYLIDNNLKERPLCKWCKEKPCNFRDGTKGYTTFCSLSCKSQGIQEQVRRTCLKKYGVDNTLVLKITKDRLKEESLKKYGCESHLSSKEVRKQIEETNLKKYGVKCTLQCDKSKDKAQKAIFDKYGVDMVWGNTDVIKKIMLDKHGVDNGMKISEAQEKSRTTCMERYGVDSFRKTSECKARKQNTVDRKNKIKFEELLKEFKIDNTYEYLESDLKELCLRNKTTNEKIVIGRQLFKDRVNRIKRGQWLIEDLFAPINFTRSTPETLLFEFIQSVYKGEIIRNSRKLIFPYEIDIYLPELKVGFEFNGCYWHSTRCVDKEYHEKKTLLCENKDIRLFHIFEDEWWNEEKRDYLKSQIELFLSNKQLDSKDKNMKDFQSINKNFNTNEIVYSVFHNNTFILEVLGKREDKEFQIKKINKLESIKYLSFDIEKPLKEILTNITKDLNCVSFTHIEDREKPFLKIEGICIKEIFTDSLICRLDKFYNRIPLDLDEIEDESKYKLIYSPKKKIKTYLI